MCGVYFLEIKPVYNVITISFLLQLGIIHKELPEDADMMESLLGTMHKTG